VLLQRRTADDVVELMGLSLERAGVFRVPATVTLMINRRGSTGYGQKFTDEITNDWGGKPYVDVMRGVDTVLAKYKFVDGTRMAAAGGSYGGYMADWIATHSGRFKAIISHAGIYDKFFDVCHGGVMV